MAETAAPGTTVVTERHPIAHGERVAAAVEAEEEALRRGGCVVRLAGLYSEVRGPHRVYLSRRELPGNASRLVNLVHVDDAARSVVAALEKGLAARGRVFLVADGEPVSRKDIARLALELEEYRGREMPVFEEENGPLEGKVYDCSWTRQQLGWSPRFRSFRHFVEERARR